jgi:hypothetical protein
MALKFQSHVSTRLYAPETTFLYLVLIYLEAEHEHRAIVRLRTLDKLKRIMTSWGLRRDRPACSNALQPPAIPHEENYVIPGTRRQH